MGRPDAEQYDRGQGIDQRHGPLRQKGESAQQAPGHPLPRPPFDHRAMQQQPAGADAGDSRRSNITPVRNTAMYTLDSHISVPMQPDASCPGHSRAARRSRASALTSAHSGPIRRGQDSLTPPIHHPAWITNSSRASMRRSPCPLRGCSLSPEYSGDLRRSPHSEPKHSFSSVVGIWEWPPST